MKLFNKTRISHNLAQTLALIRVLARVLGRLLTSCASRSSPLTREDSDVGVQQPVLATPTIELKGRDLTRAKINKIAAPSTRCILHNDLTLTPKMLKRSQIMFY